MKYHFLRIGIFGLLTFLRAIEGGKEMEQVKTEEITVPTIQEIKPMVPYLLLSLQKTDCPGDDQLSTIVGEANRIGFFDLAREYPTNGVMIRELPTTITSINQLSKAHSVTNSFDSPKRLRSFENYITTLFDQLNWQRVVE